MQGCAKAPPNAGPKIDLYSTVNGVYGFTGYAGILPKAPDKGHNGIRAS